MHAAFKLLFVSICFVCVCAFLSVCLSVSLSVCLSVFPAVCLPVCLSVCHSVFVCLIFMSLPLSACLFHSATAKQNGSIARKTSQGINTSRTAEQSEAFAQRSHTWRQPELPSTKGGTQCKCQAKREHREEAVQGSEQPRNPPQQKNRGVTGAPRGAAPANPSALEDAAGKGAGPPRPVGGTLCRQSGWEGHFVAKIVGGKLCCKNGCGKLCCKNGWVETVLQSGWGETLSQKCLGRHFVAKMFGGTCRFFF